MVGPGGQYEIDFFEKCVFFGKLDELSGGKSYTLRRFDVFSVATGSYMVELKRVASRKLFRQVPGLQDVKNRPKLIKIRKSEKSDFAGFLAVFSGPIFPVGSAAWGASQGYWTPHLYQQMLDL